MVIGAKKLARLIDDLSNADSEKRHMAAEALAESDERAIYPLIRALKDENPGVQDAAMRSLVRIGGETVAYMVIPLLRDEPLLRNTAIIILKEIGSPAVRLLRPLLKDKDYDIRKFAIDLICEIRECDYSDELVRLLAEDPNPNVRASAAKAIALLRYEEGLPQLKNALKDEEWVCFSALESLSMLRDGSSVADIEALLGSPSESIRYAAIDTLGKIGSPASGEALLEYLRKADDFEKPAIVKSLIQIGVNPSSREVSDILVDMLSNGDWDERIIALKGLASAKEESSVPSIVDLASSLDPSEPDDEERLMIIKETLKHIGCSDTLIGVLNDPSIRYKGRKIAVEVLGELGCRKAVPQILILLEKDFRDVRRAAAKALGDMPDENTGAILLDAIDDEDGHVRKEAVAALGRIGDKASFGPILSLLKAEPYRDVADEAVRALLSIDAEEFLRHLNEFQDHVKGAASKYANDADTLLHLSRDENPQVRIAALGGLRRIREERACKRINEALHDEKPEVRKAAIMAMSEMGCSYDDIKSSLEDQDMWVRVYAVKSLSHSLKVDAMNSLKPMLNDKDLPVVLSAIEAIAQFGNEDAFGILNPLLEHEDEEVREKVQQVIFGTRSREDTGVETWK